MLTRGLPPYLECSTKGDKRFSAKFARMKRFAGRTIDDIFEAAKVFPDGSTGGTARENESKTPINLENVHRLYRELWVGYLLENPDLGFVLLKVTGLSDKFGFENGVSPAIVLWECRQVLIRETARDL